MVHARKEKEEEKIWGGEWWHVLMLGTLRKCHFNKAWVFFCIFSLFYSEVNDVDVCYCYVCMSVLLSRFKLTTMWFSWFNNSWCSFWLWKGVVPVILILYSVKMFTNFIYGWFRFLSFDYFIQVIYKNENYYICPSRIYSNEATFELLRYEWYLVLFLPKTDQKLYFLLYLLPYFAAIYLFVLINWIKWIYIGLINSKETPVLVILQNVGFSFGWKAALSDV